MNDENVYAPPTSELEVSENPASYYELASRWARLAGALVDSILGMIVIFPTMYVFGFWDRATAGNTLELEVILFGLFGFAMFIVMHGYLLAKQGQTIGKKLLGTRIVSIHTNTILPLWKVILLRYLPVNVVAYLPFVGSLLILIDNLFIFGSQKRCVHDLIAGTRVVKA